MELCGFLASWNDEVLAISNIFIALGTVVLAVGIPYSIKAAAREERASFYATIDRTYFDIQKLLIDFPHLAQTDSSQKTSEQMTQYNAFALMVWNFIETIYDYSEEDKTLAVTWDGVLRHEARMHSAWFLQPENRSKFKGAFVAYVEREHLVNDASAGR